MIQNKWYKTSQVKCIYRAHFIQEKETRQNVMQWMTSYDSCNKTKHAFRADSRNNRREKIKWIPVSVYVSVEKRSVNK